jgi:Flp pilus assembly pilin Flp
MRLNSIKRLLKEEEGQGTTEYIIIVSLIAIATIALWITFSEEIKTFIGDITSEFGTAHF